MSDQEVPVVEPRPRRSAAPWIILALVVILVGLAVYFLVSKRAAVEDPAVYLPKDSVMAVTFDFTKTKEKEAAMDVIRGIFKDAGIDDLEKKLFEEINKELKLDFEKEVLSRLNGRGGGAMLPEMVNMVPGMIVVVGTNTDADAAALMTTADKTMKRDHVEAQKATYEGFSYFVIPERNMRACLGAVKSAMVFASTESAFKKAVDTVNGKQPNLLQDANFTRLREASPATFATFFFSGPNYYKLLQPFMAMGMAQMPPEAMQTIKDMFENVQASVGSAAASAEGIMFRATGVSKNPASRYDKLSLEELAAPAPNDAAFVCTMAGWDKMWADFKKQLLSNATLKAQVDQGIQGVKAEFGFDPLADALDRITMVTAYYTPGRPATSSAFPGRLTVILKVDKPAVVKSALDKIQGKMATGGAVLPAMDIAGETAYAIPTGDENIKLAYAMVGDTVVFIVAGPDVRDQMTRAIQRAQGKGANASSSDGFKLVKKYLPGQATTFMFVDAAPVLAVFKDELGAELDAEQQKVADAITKRIGAFGLTGEQSGRESSVQAVIPFKK